MHATLNAEQLSLKTNKNGTFTVQVGSTLSGIGVVFEILVDSAEIKNTPSLTTKGIDVLPAPATSDHSLGEGLHSFRVWF
jgi:hypothetical protein